MNRESALVTGGLTRWDDRPALVLVPTSKEGVAWLHDLFTELSCCEAGETLRFDDLAEVALDGVGTIELRVTPWEPQKLVLTDGADGITWTCNVSDWATLASLLEPFLAGKPGHLYLHHGFGGSDEADIVISYEEGVSV